MMIFFWILLIVVLFYIFGDNKKYYDYDTGAISRGSIKNALCQKRD